MRRKLMSAIMTKQINDTHAAWYSSAFKGWDAKSLGPKPTADMLHSIHGLKARPGKQALACAMALRDGGVTGAQIVMACGAPQLNKMRGFITDGLLKREPVSPDAKGHTVYKLAVTAKGTKRIEATDKAAAALAEKQAGEAGDKPAKKATGKRKAKGTKVTPKAETPTGDAGTGTDSPLPPTTKPDGEHNKALTV